jgi:hypothetical protein
MIQKLLTVNFVLIKANKAQIINKNQAKIMIIVMLDIMRKADKTQLFKLLMIFTLL